MAALERTNTMKITADMVCAIALGIGLIGCIVMGMENTAGVIVGAIGGYMGKVIGDNRQIRKDEYK